MNQASTGLKRSVRLLDLVMIGAGTAIGASIFSILGPSAEVAGSGILVTLLIAALPMAIFGVIYAFMSSTLPKSGASYEWQRAFVHPAAAFVVVWLRIMGSALLMVTMGSVLVNYLGKVTGYALPGKLVILGFFTVVFVANLVGVAVAARAQTIVMGLLLTVFTIFVVASGPKVDMTLVGDPLGHGWFPILAAVPLMIHLFMGIEAATEIGEEVENAERVVPLGLALSLLLSGGVYVAVATTALGLLGPQGLAASHTPLLSAAEISLGRWAPPLIGVAAVLALLKSMNSIFLVYSRFLFAMGRSGVLPSAFARIHPKFGTPWVAVVCAYVCSVAALLLAGNLIFLFLATTLPHMAKYFSTCLASVRLVRNHPELHAQARMRMPAWLVQAVAITGMVLAVLIAAVGFKVDPQPYLLIGGWLLVGLIYLAFRRWRAPPGAKTRDDVSSADATGEAAQ